MLNFFLLRYEGGSGEGSVFFFNFFVTYFLKSSLGAIHRIRNVKIENLDPPSPLRYANLNEDTLALDPLPFLTLSVTYFMNSPLSKKNLN